MTNGGGTDGHVNPLFLRSEALLLGSLWRKRLAKRDLVTTRQGTESHHFASAFACVDEGRGGENRDGVLLPFFFFQFVEIRSTIPGRESGTADERWQGGAKEVIRADDTSCSILQV